MASETEASCESDPNFAIICAFMEKFGEACGIANIDFVELQQMLENNQEVPLELVNLHIKLLRKTKKNVTVERWERALINMCHTFSSKDAWEIERFGYKKTRLRIKLRALKELLEMQFDYNTKFKNEVNKMTAENLRSQPLGRDKLGRAYWYQTDNNYQIRIYKEDPDEETWKLIAKDREGLLSLIAELTDGDSKLSSDSACNEDSNSLLDKPFIDTGQNESSNESKPKEEKKEKIEEDATLITKSTFALTLEEKKSDGKNSNEEKSESEKKSVIDKDKAEEEAVKVKSEKTEEKKPEPEVKRPMLRIKSLSELMEKPKEPPKTNFLPDLPELTIIKKPKLGLPEITIVKKSRMQQQPRIKGVQVSPAIEAPIMIIRGSGSGRSNQCGNPIVGEEIEESVMLFTGRGSGRDCDAGNEKRHTDTTTEGVNQPDDNFVVSEEIEEPVMYFCGRGLGRDCDTGNEKESSKMNEGNDKLDNANTCTSPPSQIEAGDVTSQVPTSNISNFKLGTIIDSKTDSKTFLTRDPSKKSRWDQVADTEVENNDDTSSSPKKMTFFFGPGSLNAKPSPALNSSSDDLELDSSKEMQEIENSSDDIAENIDPSNGSDVFSDEVTEVSKASETDDVPENLITNSPPEESNAKYQSIDEDSEEKISEQSDSKRQQITGINNEQNDVSQNCNIVEKENHREKLESDVSSEEEEEQVPSSVLEEPKIDSKSLEPVSNNDLLNDSARDNIDDKSSKDLGVNNDDKVTEGEEDSSDEVSKEVPFDEKSDIEEKDDVEPSNSENESSVTKTKETEYELVESPNKSDEVEDPESSPEKPGVIAAEEKQNVPVQDDEVPKDCDEESTETEPKKIENNTEENPEIVSTSKDTRTNESDAEKVEECKSNDKSEGNIEAPINNDTKDVAEATEIVNEQEEEKSSKKKSFTNDKSNEESKKDYDHKMEAEVEEQSNERKIENQLSKTEEIDKEEDSAEKSPKVHENLDTKDESQEIEEQKDVSDKKDKPPKSKELIKENLVTEEIKAQEVEETPSKRKRMTRSRLQENDLASKEKTEPTKKLPGRKRESKVNKDNSSSIKKQNDADKAQTKDTSKIAKPTVEIAATRSTRQTRQTRAGATAVSAPTPPPVRAQPVKGKGKTRKTQLQTSKSDETGSTDSPIPLESVTIVDADSNSAAADNTETDPLAVSEEEIGKSNQTMTSITSFSFDYDPNSPAPQKSSARNLRKRGREALETKPEAGESSGKRPKIKVKRAIDLTLRKSVEEKRQQEVGDVSSDESESVKSPAKKETKGKAVKKISPKKKVSSSVSDSDNASQKSISTKKSAARNKRLLKNLGVTEEEYSAIAESPAPVRQSRRLAQIKIKEDASSRKIDEEDTSTKKKKKKVDDKVKKM